MINNIQGETDHHLKQAQITYQHSQTEEKYHQTLLDMKALYKSRLKKMYEDISKKKKKSG
ncbi:hypothetical protein BCR32DRAFT_280497 [Anaeromyces robustus]|uniref:Uncharacterized protein n=1 Tax=Anaeromyces robustus TaxID=1754192 RepID=A0A1Y1X451_9FUNG|nr:hypothetical protein BCR32DRAFT_280497 [Anaeromyces robustus]|eukprot:ORX80482.1 hypothetical protein BCR32DRAFT_280497 [Anaeromyces robustus]